MRLRPGDVAVVTGAGSGIGYALSESFALRGLRVVMADLRKSALQDAAVSLGADDGQLLGVTCDVADADSVERLAAATLDRFGQIDVICNVAGISGPRAPMWEQELSAWRWSLDVLLMGVVHGVRAFVPHFIERGRGHVVNMASIGGLIPLPLRTPYNAAKHAVIGMSETLQAELQDLGTDVGVTVVCPGHVETPLAENSLATRPAEVRDWGAVPRGPRRHGSVISAKDVAAATVAAIERNQLHVLTNADTEAAVRARVSALLQDLPGEPEAAR